MQKTQNCLDVPHGTSKPSANFSFERSKIKVTGLKFFKIWRRVYLWEAKPADQARRGRRLRTRPMPLLGLLYCHRLGNGTNGCIQYRCGHLLLCALILFRDIGAILLTYLLTYLLKEEKMHCWNCSTPWVKKQDTKLFSITLPNIDRFSISFHYYTR